MRKCIIGLLALIASAIGTAVVAPSAGAIEVPENICMQSYPQDLGFVEAAYGAIHVTCGVGYGCPYPNNMYIVLVDYFDTYQGWLGAVEADCLPSFVNLRRITGGNQWSHTPAQLQFSGTRTSYRDPHATVNHSQPENFVGKGVASAPYPYNYWGSPWTFANSGWYGCDSYNCTNYTQYGGMNRIVGVGPDHVQTGNFNEWLPIAQTYSRIVFRNYW